MFAHLLVATDLNDGLQRLAAHGADLAQAGVQNITVAHAVPLDESSNIPRPNPVAIAGSLAKLQALQATNAEPQPTIRLAVESGKASSVIVEAVQQTQPDVVLMGMEVCNLLSEKLFGSTTLGVLKQTKTPLFIIRPPLLKTWLDDELSLRCQHLWQHLLIPFDGSQAAQALVDRLHQQWQQVGAGIAQRLTLCWVVDTVADPESVVAERTKIAQQQLQGIQAKLVDVAVQVVLQIRYGNPVLEILATAQEINASAIAVSSGNVGGLRELSIPSFAGEMLRRSWHPVLFLPIAK